MGLGALRALDDGISEGDLVAGVPGHGRSSSGVVRSMDEYLWRGPDLKLEYAMFHLDRMAQSIQEPQPTQHDVAILSSGAMRDGNWRQPFFAYFDAFLVATRSVPEIINYCFGMDRFTERWVFGLVTDEKRRRIDFNTGFKPHYKGFRDLLLSKQRNITLHRLGHTEVEVRVTGIFGVTYTGGPLGGIPLSETRQIENPDLAHLAKPRVLRPQPQDFKLDGQQLFDLCRQYLGAATQLREEARSIAEKVHGGNKLTTPPLRTPPARRSGIRPTSHCPSA